MKKPHYGWVICLGCTLLLFTTMGLIANVFSVYRPYIIAQLGFSNTQCAMITTIRCLFSLVAMCFIRPFYQKFNIRLGTGIAILICVFSYVIFGLSKSIAGFYTAAAFAGIGYGLGSMFPISLIIDRWFARKKALALSICSIGSGIASIIFPSIITSIIENSSMQAASRHSHFFPAAQRPLSDAAGTIWPGASGGGRGKSAPALRAAFEQKKLDFAGAFCHLVQCCFLLWRQ